MTRRKTRIASRWPQILVVVGIGVLIAAILIMKSNTGGNLQAGMLPEKQLQQALADGKPAVVFFHSLDCDPCVQMMDTVDQVHPEFEDTVVLVDVNVSDTRNHDLLRAEGIRAIPSLVFYNRAGQSDISYGVVTPDYLHERLQNLAGR